MPSKKSITLASIIALAAIILVVGLIWYFSRLPGREKISGPEKSEEEKMIERQMDELELLRKEAVFLMPSVQGQTGLLKELEKLRQKPKPFSLEQIQKQLEEMDKLRAQ